MNKKVTFQCPTCGRWVTRVRDDSAGKMYCSFECANMARGQNDYEEGYARLRNKAGDLPHDMVKIVITEEIPVFPQFRPVVGKVYRAERYRSDRTSGATGYVIVVNGTRINVREAECSVVEAPPEEQGKPKEKLCDEGTLQRLRWAFPGSHINGWNEFVIDDRANQFFPLHGCKTEKDLICLVLENLPRGACTAVPRRYRSDNLKFREFLLSGINTFLHTNFCKDEMMCIYEMLHGGKNRRKTIRFIESGFDMGALRGEG